MTGSETFTTQLIVIKYVYQIQSLYTKINIIKSNFIFKNLNQRKCHRINDTLLVNIFSNY